MFPTKYDINLPTTDDLNNLSKEMIKQVLYDISRVRVGAIEDKEVIRDLLILSYLCLYIIVPSGVSFEQVDRDIQALDIIEKIYKDKELC